jgi:hypothetical protein
VEGRAHHSTGWGFGCSSSLAWGYSKWLCENRRVGLWSGRLNVSLGSDIARMGGLALGVSAIYLKMQTHTEE